MKGTRGEIVELLRARGECTVAALAEAVGIAPAALRRHLEILAGEGMVEYRTVKQATGRPFYAYRLTEQAREIAAANYPRILERLVTEMVALGTAETADKDGHAILDTVFGHMADQLAADYRDRVHGDSMEERVSSLTLALRDEGIVERWEKRADGFHLTTSGCPHTRAARAAHSLCASEAQAISLLLGTEVEQLGRVVDGAACCEYLVKCGELPVPSAVRVALTN